MQKARNIPVAVSPELQSQARSPATDCDTSVNEKGFTQDSMVRFLLQVQPSAASQTCFSALRLLCAAAKARRRQPAKMSTQTPPDSPKNRNMPPKIPPVFL